MDARNSSPRPVGLTKDAGWQIGARSTVAAPLAAVWAYLTSDEGLDLWLGKGARPDPAKGSRYRAEDGTTGVVKSYHREKRFRLSWHPPGWGNESTLQVTVSHAVTGTTIGFHQERLASEAQRNEMRSHWRRVLEALQAQLSGE
jgi:uncharacterized protein YndB with AHSA1/START domain